MCCLFCFFEDMPSVVSGRHVAFLDPQEAYFGAGETGRKYDLRDPLLAQYRDQFTPFENVFGCKISSGFHDGTLFRLPLRKWPSRISVRSYTASKVKALFEAFIQEAPTILLFLKHVESISLYETNWNQKEKPLFTVRIKESEREEIRNKKHEFLNFAAQQDGRIHEMTCHVKMEEILEGKWSKQRSFLVLNRVGSDHPRLAELSSRLHQIPWAGVACPLQHDTSESQGRVFCFLPLPSESDCSTGLNVHIHGTFGLTDDRRSLRWPGPECQSNDAAEWNVLLLKDVVGKAYANLVSSLAQSGHAESERILNNIWPEVGRMQRHWKELLVPFLRSLVSKPVFWTASKGGRWIALSQAIFDAPQTYSSQIKQEVKDVLITTLLDAGEPVVKLPEHAFGLLREHSDTLKYAMQVITPSYVHKVLTKEVKELKDCRDTKLDIYEIGKPSSRSGEQPIWSVLGRAQRLRLLEFMLTCGSTEDLEGLPLLPLADKSFTTFKMHPSAAGFSEAVFVASRHHQRNILPGSAHRFLDEDVPDNLLQMLRAIAMDREKTTQTVGPATQLVKLTRSAVPQLMRESIPEKWKTDDAVITWDTEERHFGEMWLRNLWSWLRVEFPEDLGQFKGIPLLPHSEGSPERKYLVKLGETPNLIQSTSHFATLPLHVTNALQKLGCIVLSRLPSFCDHHALKQFIEPPTPSGVLRVLAYVQELKGTSALIKCTPEEKLAIRAFLSNMRNPSDDEVVTLMSLPIFTALDGQTFTSVRLGGPVTGRKLDVAPPRLEMPSNMKIVDSEHMLSAADDDSFQLLRRLPVRIFSMADFLIEKVFPHLKKESFYTEQQIVQLMTSVLQRLPILSSDKKDFPEHLRTLRFIPVPGGGFMAPCDMYDPEDETLTRLFEGQPDAFPTQEFAKPHALSILRVFLGLRRSRSLTARDINMIADQIDGRTDEISQRRGEALFRFLNDNPFLLEKVICTDTLNPPSNKTLAHALMNKRWIPASSSPPNGFPARMPWFQSTRVLYSPEEIRDCEVAHLVGSVMPLRMEVAEERVKSTFRWTTPLSPPLVLEQLKTAATIWQNTQAPPMEIFKFQTMLRAIYDYLSKESVLAEVSHFLKDDAFPPWVWNGSGFSKPSYMALSSTCPFDMKPHAHVISQDFAKYAKLFKRCGVKDSFDDGNLVDILHAIRENHAEQKRNDEVVERDLRVANDILKFLTREGRTLPTNQRDRLLVPTQSTDGSLELVPLAEVSFCDAKWLRNNEDGRDISFTTPLVHDSVSAQTAELLGTEALSKRLAVVEALDFEQIGPHESVTTRLKNIIKDHKDDLVVFKELLQNAEDSGATEVRFMIDCRKHRGERLLSPEMEHVQGPALWVYNDAFFTDKDFENITKLAGATKVGTKNKIGRFGIGFCSVYNFTDVPSFISREYVAIFDPQMKYLGNLVKNGARPGIRLNLKTNPRVVGAFPDQFAPYEGVFGCSFDSNVRDFHFDGTLFRFPLRTLRQAGASEICNNHYDEDSFSSLTRAFHQRANQLLLFLKNVEKVSFHEMEECADGSHKPRLLFEVSKTAVESIPRGAQLHASDSFLHLRTPTDSREPCSRLAQRDEQPSSVVVSLQSSTEPCRWFNTSTHGEQRTEVWMITTSTGQACSVELITDQERELQGLVPEAEVAALLSSSGIPDEPWIPETVAGEVFSGLSLSMETGLPVHVNGSFAVPTNRRGIWESTGASEKCQPLEVYWNQNLLKDAAANAYVQLLEDVAYLQCNKKVAAFPFELLWPHVEKLTSKIWKTFASHVYLGISMADKPLLQSSSRWVSFGESSFLDQKVAERSECRSIMESCGYEVVDLPRFAIKGFHRAETTQAILDRTVTYDRFLRHVFFPNLNCISPELRDPITCHVLDECLGGASRFEDLLRNSKCVPSSPCGNTLVRPRDLVDPSSPLAKLFTPGEHRFPVGVDFLRPERLVVLRKLGMAGSITSWEEICERAASLSNSKETNRDGRRAKALQSFFKYLDDHIDNLDQPTPEQIHTLRSIPFLPRLSKPNGYCLPWKATNLPKGVLLPANELYLGQSAFLIGSSQAILDQSQESGCGYLNKVMLDLLGLNQKEPETKDVLVQLAAAVKCLRQSASSKEGVRKVCTDVYEHLQQKLQTSEKDQIQSTLKDNPWILVGNKFVASNQVAFTWIGHGEPFLYRLPEEYAERFGNLFKALGVNATFYTEDIIEALFALQDRKGGAPLTSTELRTVKSFLSEIADVDHESLTSYHAMLPVPDSNLVLRPIGELAFNNAPWVRGNEKTHYVHPDIPWSLADRLGAQGIREVKLGRYAQPIGKEFGQSERLTTRLRNILHSYPCDTGILKEIVQNADDASATEVHLIYDPRSHGTTRVLSDEWAELQGPALCIYNDRPFSQGDIDGIQKVGIGSKKDNPEMTGKSGVGFNAVYHITDCPSFVTDDATMCILDPHARYAPGATKNAPGRLLDTLDEEFWVDFADVRSGFLQEFFELKGSTMFRLPLRTESMANISEISSVHLTENDVDEMLGLFEAEAREMLLFLKSVRKISVSRIQGSRLITEYQVDAKFTSNGNNHLRALQAQTSKCKGLLTRQVPWFGVTYGLTIKDTTGREEGWLVHQSLGSQQYDGVYEIPDGNMLPRVGVAARVYSQEPENHSLPVEYDALTKKSHRVFSLLPLPVNTGLPVHVNGNFTLDDSRRGLWADEDDSGPRTQWNEFIKTQALVPAYANLILGARNHIASAHEGQQWTLGEASDTARKLQWYYDLFPKLEDVNTDWTETAKSLYCYMAITSQPVLPVLRQKTHDPNKEIRRRSFSNRAESASGTCTWMPPADDEEESFVFFSDLKDPALEDTLLNIGLPLLHSPGLCRDFKAASVPVREVTPEVVMSFLSSPSCDVGSLPHHVEGTKFTSYEELARVTSFCMESESFLGRLDGLPLLLTEDGVLNYYDTSCPIFLTPFPELVPHQGAAFLHRHFADEFTMAYGSALWKTGLFRKFGTESLEPFLIHVLPPRWFACDAHVDWDRNSDAMPTREWLSLLWSLIHSTYLEHQSSFDRSEDGTDTLLPLEAWPIIPTTAGTLCSPSLGKTVLSVEPSAPREQKLVDVLRKLGCMELDFTALPGIDHSDVSRILSSYLARPNSRQDIALILHHLNQEQDLSGKLTDAEVIVLLRHMQDDLSTVYSNKSLLRSLPFFKTLAGSSVSLASFAFVYTTDLPDWIQVEQIHRRTLEEGCVLLQSIHEIHPLYKALDINPITQTEVLARYVLPNFIDMQEAERLEILTYIKDTLLFTLKNSSERNVLVNALKTADILPDGAGKLHPVSRYYDPENAVFEAMLCADNFPPPEFNTPNWLPFLRDIGLRHKISQQQFIEFAESLAEEAEVSCKDPSLTEKSRVLVGYLLEQTELHDACFLHIVSRIKFVASDRASEQLSELHVQFGCNKEYDTPQFTEFHGSVSQEQQKLVWTSSPLLPAWAIPSNSGSTAENLGIEPLPALEQVIKHLENLCSTHAGNVHKDTPKHQRELLHDVMGEVFSFFKGECVCPTTSLSERCTRSCLAIGNILRKTPCIPVEEGRVLVEGSQLAFEKAVDLPPFFYKVPREYGHLEHLLKRLGAEERPTPLQFAKILERLKEVCQDKHMEPNEKRVARIATQGFFTTLSLMVKEKSKAAASAYLSSLNELFLPSKDGFLKPSHELIFHDCPTFERRARDFAGDFVDISREGELTADRLSYLLSLLPTRQRAKTIQSLLREELHPSCEGKNCIADSEGEPCPYISHHRNILLSPKFVNGIVRVIRHQRQTPNLPQEVKGQVQLLTTNLRVKCMATLETHLVHLESGKAINNSKEAQECFLEERGGNWELFIRHGSSENPLLIQLCFLVNRLIGNQIEKEIYLQAMLASRKPDDILPSLDRCGVAQDLIGSKESTKEPALGSEIPVMYHYLLKQDITYFFRQGEIVGYEKERELPDGDADDSDPLYVYAKVVRKATNRSSPNENTKYDFQAKYRVDIGERRLVEVSVLDLYKFDRCGGDQLPVKVFSDSKEITLFTGDPRADDSQAANRNQRLERAKKEIGEALWQAWKLPEKERRKVIKRLFLKWHPDKNAESDIAHDIMQFLLNEIERLERLFPTGWREQYKEANSESPSGSRNFQDFFNQWDQRARQERRTYNTFKRQNSQNSGQAKGSSTPQRNEAKRWLRQSREDLKAATLLSSQEDCQFHALACFLCHDVAEKAFKSALYAACGIAQNQLETHDVLNLAYEITELDDSPEDIPVLAAKLKDYYDKTRYPHFHRGDVVPFEVFTSDQSSEAIEVAESILDKISNFLDETFAKV